MQPGPKKRDERPIVDPRPPKGGGWSFIQPMPGTGKGKVGPQPVKPRKSGGIMQPTVNKVYKTY
jgi:hypothetical protein